MGPMSSRDPIEGELTDVLRATLLDVARRSIEHGLVWGKPLAIDLDGPNRCPEPLLAVRATFTTLHLGEALRGCVGGFEAKRPLIADVAHTAFAAAFEDPRFPPLRESELDGLRIHLAILSPLEPLPVHSEQELLRAVRPGVDGLLLRDGARQGTFLPAVWESLPEPRDFLRHLEQKAGLSSRWSLSREVYRYTTISIG